MSIRIMSAVWESGIEDKAELLVMLALADFANDMGECWPSIATIARKARMSSRSVQRTCRDLESAGRLIVDTSDARAGCNKYRLTPDTRVTPDNLSPLTPVSPEPSLNHKEPSEKNTRDARDIIAELMSVVSEETAKAFVDHRKAKRAKLTWYAANLIAKKLSGHGNPDAVLLASIENGWTGVFPEKQQSKGQQGGHSKGERKLQSWLAGSSVAPRVDSWTDTDPSQPLLARR